MDKGREGSGCKENRMQGICYSIVRGVGLDSTCVYVAAVKIVTADKKVLLLFDFSNAESWRAKSKAK